MPAPRLPGRGRPDGQGGGWPSPPTAGVCISNASVTLVHRHEPPHRREVPRCPTASPTPCCWPTACHSRRRSGRSASRSWPAPPARRAGGRAGRPGASALIEVLAALTRRLEVPTPAEYGIPSGVPRGDPPNGLGGRRERKPRNTLREVTRGRRRPNCTRPCTDTNGKTRISPKRRGIFDAGPDAGASRSSATSRRKATPVPREKDPAQRLSNVWELVLPQKPHHTALQWP
jgi:hypothetical protein